MKNYLKLLINRIKILNRIGTKKLEISQNQDFNLPDDFQFCHKETVHIFVRGLADGKMHVARNRNYSDFRFYKKQGLRVFCAICRKRLV